MDSLTRAWQAAKRRRRLPLGPVALYYRVGRNIRVSSNLRRRFVRNFAKVLSLAMPVSHLVSPIAIKNTPEHKTDPDRSSPTSETALLVGVGPGFGFALARKLAASGLRVALASRSAERLDQLVDELNRAGGAVCAYGCDATDEKSVMQLISLVSGDLGVPNLVVYSVQGFSSGRVIDLDLSSFENSWRQNCLGGFIVARETSKQMISLGRGTITLIGSTSSLIGRANNLNLAVGKFGLRALAQVLARELWPSGVMRPNLRYAHRLQSEVA